MKAPAIGALALGACVLVALVAPRPAEAASHREDTPGSSYTPPISRGRGSEILISRATGARFKVNAGVDTFALYGGPDAVSDGKFQTVDGDPDVLGHAPHAILPGKWFGVDRTDLPPLWQVSTFCAETLDGDGSSGGTGDGPGNQAWWAGKTAEQEPGWATPPGYGNNWDARLEWRATVADPSVGQTVDLSFAFHHDTEPGYDFFSVEYDSLDGTKVVYSVDGSDAPFAAPGVQFPADVVSAPIAYDANGYAGPAADEIVLRLRVTSDGAYSDEDGLFPTTCGAAIVDDITVQYTDGVQPLTDFSDVDNTNSWTAVQQAFAGDFSDIAPRLTDLDPCVEDRSPLALFVDRGQCPKNEGNNGGEDPCLSTGGTLSSTWDYGVPGGWVVNYTGGISELTGLQGGAKALANEIWSPVIAWDLPGTEDDDAAVVGSFLRYSVWVHLPYLNGIYYTWAVRTSMDGIVWSQWKNWDWVGEVATPRWQNWQRDVTTLVGEDGTPAYVQASLGVIDLSSLIFVPGDDATPSPAFDNVGFFKYRLRGPRITTTERDMFMDAFPQSGQADFSTLAGRQNADCRLDMRDVNTGPPLVNGDSMVVDVVSRIPGADLDQLRLRWVLDLNPAFDDVRVMPAGATVIPAGAANGWDQWTGEVDAQPSTYSSGAVVPDRYFFDPPDEDFLHPGDVFRYYVWATDTDARMATLPANLTGFDTGRGPNRELYAPRFTVHGLPSFVDDGQGGYTQPSILVVNDGGFWGNLEEIHSAFDQNGLRQGLEWDMFTTWSPTSAVSNGIGSVGGHGATPQQLSGYAIVLYTGSNLESGLLSDGTNVGNNDKGDDLGTLRGWFEQDADRAIAHFADNMVSALIFDSPTAGGDYVASVLGGSLVDSSVRDDIHGQTTPVVEPASSDFVTSYVVAGGCPLLNRFDNIEPAASASGAFTSHVFLDPLGSPYGPPGRSASITWDRTDGNDNRKVSMTFPYGFLSVWDRSGSVRGGGNPLAGVTSARTRLLDEILDSFLYTDRPGTPVAVGDPVAFRGVRNVLCTPNPFNPAATIAFEIGTRTNVSVRVYDLRGTLVATVHEGVLDAGRRAVTWRGVDDRGARVSSGVYVARIVADGMTEVRKLTLLK